MTAILLRNTAQQRQNVFVQHFCNSGFEFITKQFERSAQSWNVFQHSKRNFVSLRGNVISSIYSSSKLKTKLEVISRYLDVIPVSFREIAEKSREVTNLRAYLSTDGSHRWVGLNLGKAKIIVLSSSNKLKNKARKSKWSRDISN